MFIRTLFASVLIASSINAFAAEQSTKPEDQTAVTLTVYQQNMALIRELRQMSLPQGRSRLAVVGVPSTLMPETVLAGGSTADRLTIVGQVYESALLTPEALLQASVGKSVQIVTRNRGTGAESFAVAEVLRATGREALVRLDGRIRTIDVRRIAFDSAPSNLRARPTLVLDLDNAAAGDETLTLSYLARGLGWRADYVARLSEDETSMQLAGWVTLSNSTGTGFKNAKLRVIAGNVNRAAPVRPRSTGIMAMQSVAKKGRRAPVESAVSDLRVFDFDENVTIGGKESRQLALLASTPIKIEKEYRLYGNTSHFGSLRRDTQRSNPAVRFKFDNTKTAGLGRSLPGGTVRLYAPSKGGDIFRGQDGIRHTPVGETVTLTAGNATDITSERRQTEFRRNGLPKNVVETAHSIILRNAKDKAVTVQVIERIPGDWQMLAESLAHSKQSSNEALWRVTVPAGGKVELTYKVRTRF